MTRPRAARAVAPAPEIARLASVVLSGELPARLSPFEEADRAQALADLAVDSRFAPTGLHEPEYDLHLSVMEGRLVFDIRTTDGTPRLGIGLALGPFRALVKDYRMLLDSYAVAVQDGRGDRLEAIDMGRRGLHNEGATLLMERLRGKVDLDFDTARRLFTLICTLYPRT